MRNKVAHNRNVKKAEFDAIKGLSESIKEIINKATAKLGEIDINEEDRDLIIYSYQSNSRTSVAYLAEKEVAKYYIKSGYEILSETNSAVGSRWDFIAKENDQIICVRVSLARISDLFTLDTKFFRIRQVIYEEFKKFHFVFVLREEDIEYSMAELLDHIEIINTRTNKYTHIHVGKLDENQNFFPLTDFFNPDNMTKR